MQWKTFYSMNIKQNNVILFLSYKHLEVVPVLKYDTGIVVDW